MYAIVDRLEEGEVFLDWQKVEKPSAGSGEVLLKIHATALNRADISQAEGNYPPPKGASPILGLEAAGEIVEVGDGVSDWKVGDLACALLSGGGFAQYCNVSAGCLIPIPENFSFEQAVAIPEAWSTAYLNLIHEGGLRGGEKVLIHAGASGVGTAAIQIAKGVGAEVAVTAGSPEKLSACETLGADLAINYKSQDFCSVLKQAWGGVDLILDCVGASYLEKNVSLLRYRGRLVVIGLLGGRTGQCDLGRVLIKNLRVRGSTLRNRTLEEKVELVADFCSAHLAGFDTGDYTPLIHKELSIEDATAAFQIMRSNENIGKIVLKVS